MLFKLFTIYDIKAECYFTPFYEKSSGAAVRNFSDSVNDPNSQLHRHAGDFTLFEVGRFDDNTCSFEIFDQRINHGTALEFKNQMDLPIPDHPMPHHNGS